MVRPANCTGQSVSNRLCMSINPTGSVLRSPLLMKTRAKTNSFQANSACSSAADTRIGRHMGRMIRQKICAGEQPSSRAASSTSGERSIM